MSRTYIVNAFMFRVPCRGDGDGAVPRIGLIFMAEARKFQAGN